MFLTKIDSITDLIEELKDKFPAQSKVMGSKTVGGESESPLKRKNSLYDSDLATERTLRAIKEKKVKTITGKDIDVGCDIICVHSDTPNAVEIITKLKNAIKN